MKPQEIKDIVRRRPFRPFQIEVTTGNSYLIEDEFSAGCSSDGWMMFLFAPDGRTIRVDADEIAEIHEPAHSKATG